MIKSSKHPKWASDGIIVPGGFGIQELKARYWLQLGKGQQDSVSWVAYGLQLAVVEFARNVCGLKDAHTNRS